MGWAGREGKSIVQVGRRHKAEGRKKESKLKLLSAYCLLVVKRLVSFRFECELPFPSGLEGRKALPVSPFLG